MTTSMTTPKSVTELVKVTARLGKRAVLFSGVDPASDRLPSGKVLRRVLKESYGCTSDS